MFRILFKIILHIGFYTGKWRQLPWFSSGDIHDIDVEVFISSRILHIGDAVAALPEKTGYITLGCGGQLCFFLRINIADKDI